MSAENPVLVVVVGPTAVGKTAFCVELARHFGTEIISADSRQFFKEMSIGTAKPNFEEMDGIKHHFIDNLSIHNDYSIADFEKEGLTRLEEIFNRLPIAILTGGSGLYIKALCEGFDEIPKVADTYRQALNEDYESRGLAYLQELLKTHDPEYFDQVDKSNPQRLIRALEVCLGTGNPFSSYRKSIAKSRPFNIIKIGLELPRDLLYEKINRRMDVMIETGLFEEVEKLYPLRHLNALQTVGYKEIFDFMDNRYDREEAIRLLKRNSRRYAKRQMTWFKKDNSVHWFSPSDIIPVIGHIKEMANA